MKKLPHKKKIYLDKRSRRILEESSESPKPRRTVVHSPWPSVETPEIVRLNEADLRSQLLVTIGKLRGLVASGCSTVLDFTRTQRVFADGMLLLYAEVRRLRTDYPHVRITCRLPLRSKTSEVLKQIGMLDLLGCQAKVTPSKADVVRWKFATGSTVEGERYDEVVGIPFEGDLAEPLHEALYVGMTEAMTNVVHHAYQGDRGDGLAPITQKQWWMFSTSKDGFLTVVLCDLGVGIPGTFPFKHPSLWRRLTSLGRTRDCDVLEEAVKLGATRTGQSGRGRGLSQLLEIVNQTDQSSLTIHSNHGVYYKTPSKKGTHEFRDSIMGTLINWRIPLRQA